MSRVVSVEVERELRMLKYSNTMKSFNSEKIFKRHLLTNGKELALFEERSIEQIYYKHQLAETDGQIMLTEYARETYRALKRIGWWDPK